MYDVVIMSDVVYKWITSLACPVYNPAENADSAVS